MELTEVNIENIMQQWATDVTGDQIIIANQEASGSRVKNPYGTVSILTIVFTDMNDIRYTDIINDELEEKSRIRPVATIQVDFFGNGSRDRLMKLKASTNHTDTKLYFQENTVGFKSASSIRDLSRLSHSNWERRAQADFDFNLLGDYDRTIGTIGSVEIFNSINDEFINIP